MKEKKECKSCHVIYLKKIKVCEFCKCRKFIKWIYNKEDMEWYINGKKRNNADSE